MIATAPKGMATIKLSYDVAWFNVTAQDTVSQWTLDGDKVLSRETRL